MKRLNISTLPVMACAAASGAITAGAMWFYPYWSHRAASIDTEGKQYHCGKVISLLHCRLMPAKTHHIGEVIAPTVGCGAAAFIGILLVLEVSWILFQARKPPTSA